MKKLLLTLLLASCHAVRPEASLTDVQESAEIASHHVKIIQTIAGRFVGSGSGVVLAAGGVVTAAHVCAAPLPPPAVALLIAVDHAGRQYPAVILRQDVQVDLCLLAVPRLSAPPARLAVRPPAPGETVTTVLGVYFDDDLVPLHRHVYAGDHLVAGQPRGLVTPTFFSGDSGGAVWRGSEVVGIVVASIGSSSPLGTDLIGVMVRLEDLRRFLEAR